MKYYAEEKEILEAYDSGEMHLETPSDSEREAVISAADRTFTKDQRVTIRLYAHDLRGIQKRALEMGVPYQTLISGLIHRYVEGDVKL